MHIKHILGITTIALLTACSPKEVGDVSLGLFTTKDIKIQTFNDPAIPGVTCHISHVQADLSLADPSDMATLINPNLAKWFSQHPKAFYLSI